MLLCVLVVWIGIDTADFWSVFFACNERVHTEWGKKNSLLVKA